MQMYAMLLRFKRIHDLEVRMHLVELVARVADVVKLSKSNLMKEEEVNVRKVTVTRCQHMEVTMLIVYVEILSLSLVKWPGIPLSLEVDKNALDDVTRIETSVGIWRISIGVGVVSTLRSFGNPVIFLP